MSPFVVGVFTRWSDSQAAGMASILIFLAVGLVLMLYGRTKARVSRH